MICQNCGFHVEDTGKFCPVCGTQLSTVDAAPSQPDSSYKSADYKDSVPNPWAGALTVSCFILWFLMTFLGAFIGHQFQQPWDPGSYTFMGGVIGAIVGFFMICLPMAFLSLCKNIATMTDNTAEILKRLDQGK